MAERAEIILDARNRTGPAFDGVRKGLADVERSVSSVRANLGALAGFASAGLFAGWVKSSIDAADALGKMSERLGVTTEQLSAYQYAAKLSGSSGEDFEKGLVKLAGALSTNAKALEVFQIATGITIRTSDSLDGAINKIAEGFSKLPNGATKTALAGDLLGEKLGTRLIPLLNGGADGLARFYKEAEKLGVLVSGQTARAAQEFNDNLDRLKTSASAAGQEIARTALPALTQISEKMAEGARQGGLLRGVLEGLGEAAVVAVVGPDPTLLEYQRKKVQELKGEIIGLERTLKEAASGGEGLLDKFLYGSVSERTDRLGQAKRELADAQKLLGQLENPPKPKAPAKQDDPYEIQRKREEATKKAAEAAKKQAAEAKRLQEEQIAFGKALSDQEIQELERKFDRQARITEEINQKKIEALQLGPTLAERDPTEGFRRVQELLAGTTRGKSDAITQDVAALNEQLAAGTISADRYRDVFDDIQKRYSDLVPDAQGLNSDLDNQSEAFKRLEAAVKGWGNAFNEEFVQGLKRGQFQASKLVDQLITDIARLTTYRFITQPIFTGLGNLIGTNAAGAGGTPFGYNYGGGRAMGGPVLGGHWYDVGENGPERLYMPRGSSGTIVPSGGTGGGIGTLVVAPNIQAGASYADVYQATLAAAALARSEIGREFRTGAV